ncbi:MAG: biotin/lipoyl-binding protein [Kiritimatiellia bacterium]|nr:biotin/lipoyl-binding protein [Kiritimatiellia bacterium]
MGDYRTTSGEPPGLPRVERRRIRRRRWGLAALSLPVLMALGYFIQVHRIIVASGYVASEDYAEIRPPIEGVVAEIRISSGRSANQGDVLARLDDSEQAAQEEEARSRLRKLEADLRLREADIAERKRARAHEVEVARLREKNAASKLARAREMQERGLASAATVEDYSLQQELAAAELTARLERDPSLLDRELEAMRFERDAQAEAVTRAEAQRRRRERPPRRASGRAGSGSGSMCSASISGRRLSRRTRPKEAGRPGPPTGCGLNR